MKDLGANETRLNLPKGYIKLLKLDLKICKWKLKTETGRNRETGRNDIALSSQQTGGWLLPLHQVCRRELYEPLAQRL